MNQIPISRRITNVLRGEDFRTFLLYVEGETKRAPLPAVTNQLYRFFDKCYPVYEEDSPKDFVVYCQYDGLPAMQMAVKLIAEEFTVERSVIGHDGPPAEDVFPYSLDFETLTEMEDESDFPPKLLVALAGLKNPGVNAVDEKIMGMMRKHNAPNQDGMPAKD